MIRNYGRHAANLILQLNNDESTIRILREQADWFCRMIDVSIENVEQRNHALQGVSLLCQHFCAAIYETNQERRLIEQCMETPFDFLPSFSEEIGVQIQALLDGI